MISKDMKEKMDDMKSKLDDRKKNPVVESHEVSLPVQRTFPGWEAETRAAPNALLRGALFCATQGKNRRLCERELIASLEGYEIRYTGIQLTQLDLNLWETILHIARNNPLGEEVSFSVYEILKEMGRGHSSRDYESLKKSLARLRSADVEIKIKDGKTYFGPLCGISGELDERTESYRFKFSAGLISLFDSGWSKLDYQHRVDLKDKPLALWLHGLFSSHAKPYPIKVETIHKLCGSDTKELRNFKIALKKSLKQLVLVGCLKSFKFDKNLLKVTKISSKSQVKHLKNRGQNVK